MSFMDVLRLRAKIVREWRQWVIKIADAIKIVLPDAEVYVFGSVIKGDSTGGSDIDLLVISKDLPKRALDRAKLKVKIEDAANLPFYHPFEIHLSTPEEAELYFMKVGNNIWKLPMEG